MPVPEGLIVAWEFEGLAFAYCLSRASLFGILLVYCLTRATFFGIAFAFA